MESGLVSYTDFELFLTSLSTPFESVLKVCKILRERNVSEQKNYCITKANKITLSRFVRILYYFVDNLVCDGFAN